MEPQPDRRPVNFNEAGTLAAVDAWWRWLNENPRERALLRRCHDLQDIAFTRGYARLRVDLLKIGTVNPKPGAGRGVPPRPENTGTRSVPGPGGRPDGSRERERITGVSDSGSAA